MLTVGIDEVGRGCWAGPLVAGAVLLSAPILGLKDSKKISKARRQFLVEQIQACSLAVGLGWVNADELDAVGMSEAVRIAMQRALNKIKVAYDEIIIDGNYNYLSDNLKAKAVIKADDTIPSVSAASIVAKVARDKFMTEQALKYPEYGFDKHVGYGTKQHDQAIKICGICELHRLTFRPIIKYI